MPETRYWYGLQPNLPVKSPTRFPEDPIKKEDLTDKSILLGPPEKIVETLKRVEAAGITEVILYFNVGNKPHPMVKDQMAKFMEEIAPEFSTGDIRAALG